MNVCLVTSPRFNCKPVRKSLAPLGLAYLAAVARKAGHNVTAVEGVMIGDPNEIARQVAAAQPDVVGTSTVSMDRLAGIRTIRAIRKACPTAFIVVGGSHFTHTAENALRVVPQIDAVVLYEGEQTFLELLDRLPDRSALSAVKGLVYRDGDGVIHRNALRELMSDIEINQLPMPAWDLFGPGQYDFHRVDRESAREAGVITTRGCPYSCIFCANAIPTKVRFIDPAKAVDEMMWLHKTYQITDLDVMDDNFLTRKSHVVGFCEELLRRNAPFRWWCGARAKDLDPDVLKLMRRAGCTFMAFGVETGSDSVLTAIHKGVTTAEMRQAMHTVSQAGFEKVGVCLIIGLPGETPETIDESVTFLREIKQILGPAWARESIIGQLPLIYPGTGLEPLGRQEGCLPENFSWNSPYMEPKRYLPLINHRYQTVPHFQSRSMPLERICKHIKDHYWDELAPGRHRRYRMAPLRRIKVALGLA